jgi:hypothetical protein
LGILILVLMRVRLDAPLRRADSVRQLSATAKLREQAFGERQTLEREGPAEGLCGCRVLPIGEQGYGLLQALLGRLLHCLEQAQVRAATPAGVGAVAAGAAAWALFHCGSAATAAVEPQVSR